MNWHTTQPEGEKNKERRIVSGPLVFSVCNAYMKQTLQLDLRQTPPTDNTLFASNQTNTMSTV